MDVEKNRYLPALLAVIMTVLNSTKPVVVDDTAYLMFARHLATNPLQPYDFALFWYSAPQPAMEVLLPPVLPYWLACGINLLSEHLLLLKLWLFPFAWLFCESAAFLLRRFARRTTRDGIVLLAFSPAVLPLFNFMLDVPAVALGLASVACLIRGCENQRVRWLVLGGIAAGLAAQTKYTMISLPAVLLWYGFTQRKVWRASVAIAIGLSLFVAWEFYVTQVCGESHFLHHLHAQQPIGGDLSFSETLQNWWSEKSELAKPMVGYLGGLAVVSGLYAGRALGFPRWVVIGTAIITALGLVAVCVTPYSESLLLRNAQTGTPRLQLSELVFNSLGTAVVVTILLTCFALLVRRRKWKVSLRINRMTWFLVGWLAIEVGAYFVLTPFPAARRVMMIAILFSFIASRLVSRVRRVKPNQWVVIYGVVFGCTIFALDCWDAWPERQLAYRASATIGERGQHQVWTQGHWGWQYYTDRLGMKLVHPGHTLIHRGDWLVVPLIPNEDEGFYRPDSGRPKFVMKWAVLEPIGDHVWDDPLPYQTVPTLYGGVVPILGRDHPRLRVGVYRVAQDWTPQPLPK